ncbi:PAS domain S-box protein [Candidatus Woesearchaeota archaeon]|nr:PAS domain S-box protein [Candidatus Woesearchaeota archaeon]
MAGKKELGEELRESGEIFRIVFESATDGIIAADTQERRFHLANPRMCEITGYSLDELLQLSVEDIHPGKDLPYVMGEFAKQVRGEATLARDIPVLRKDGNVVYYDVNSRLLTLGNQELLLGFFRDITERREVEEELRESQRRFRQFFEDNPEYCYMISTEGNILDINQRALDALGYTKEEILGRPLLTTIYAPSSQDKARGLFMAWKETGVLKDEELTIATKTGEERTVVLNVESVRDHHGNLMYSVSVQKDITEFRRTEVEMSKNRARLDHLLLSSPAVIYSAQPDGDYPATFISEKIREVTGYEASEFLDNPQFWIDHVHPDDLQVVFKEVPLLFEKGYHVYEYRFRCKDDSYIWVQDSMSLLCDASGRPLEIVGYWADITEKKRLEEQLRHSQKMEAIGTLAGGVAHEFNNILTGVLGYASMLKSDSKPGDGVHEPADMIEKSAKRAARLAKQLLGFARKGKYRDAPLDVREAIVEVTGLLTNTIPRNISITQNYRAECHTVKGDPDQLQQVFMNLAINARDAMPHGGELTFETRIAPQDEPYIKAHPGLDSEYYLCVSVSDTGDGIPETYRDRIFEPFFTTKGVGKGTGMGLAMAYGIIENHGGSLDVTSAEGEGTRFDVYLPVHGEVDLRRDEQSLDARVYGSGRILIVDDEKIIRHFLSQSLENLGYNVVCVADGKQAIDYYGEHQDEVDLVLLDLTMPVMSGVDCFHELKRINPNVRALLSTGHSAEGVASELGLEYLQKPYTVEDISEAVAKTLGKKEG